MYHRRQIEISEMTAHVESLKRQRNALLSEVTEQDTKLASLDTQLIKQVDQGAIIFNRVHTFSFRGMRRSRRSNFVMKMRQN